MRGVFEIRGTLMKVPRITTIVYIGVGLFRETTISLVVTRCNLPSLLLQSKVRS